MADDEKKKDEVIWVESSELTCPNWMMTFGDCMSLLLCFFVLLLTFSTKNDAKLMDVVGIIKGALSPVASPAQIKQTEVAEEAQQGGTTEKGKFRQRKVAPDKMSSVNLRTYEFTEKRSKLTRRLKAIGFEKYVSLSVLDEGISLRIDLKQVFKPNSLELRDTAYEAMEGFAILCTGVGNEVRLTGNIPSDLVRTPRKYIGQWNLTMQRIGKVGQLLTSNFSIKQNRLSYGTAIVANEEKTEIELLLVERSGIKLVQPEDLTKELMELQKK